MVSFGVEARTRKAAISKFRRLFLAPTQVIVRVRWAKSIPRKGGLRTYLVFVRNRKRRR